MKPTGLTYEIDLEPKVQASSSPGEPGWHHLDITPSIEYSLSNTVDVLGELTIGRTKQTDALKTTVLRREADCAFISSRASEAGS